MYLIIGLIRSTILYLGFISAVRENSYQLLLLHHYKYMYTNDFDIDVLTGSGTLKAGCGSDNKNNYSGRYYLRNTEGLV